MGAGDPSHEGKPTGPSSTDRLDSWKEIAAYLKREPRTVQRWEKKEGLPVHRHLHDKLGTVYAFKSELDTWWSQRRPVLESEPEDQPEDATTQSQPEESPSEPHPHPQASFRDRVILGLVLGAFVFGVIVAVWYNFFSKATKAPKTMIAVLPFEGLSGDPAEQYFPDGLTEEMITQLGRLQPERLGVIARTTTMRYRGSGKSISEIGMELNVQYVVEGSVRRAEDRVRISAQLIEVKGQSHIWAENYDRPFGDVLGIQSEVAGNIAKSLAVELLPAEQARLAARRQIRPQAYEAYLKGRFYANRRRGEDFLRALQFFEQASRLDPNLAEAYAGLADAQNLLAFYSVLRPKDAYPKSESYIAQALALDERLAEAHTSRADLLYTFRYDWDGAEKEFQRAIVLNPSLSVAHQWFAQMLVLQGRGKESFQEITRAQQLDPLSAPTNTDVALHYFFTRQYDRAIEQCQKVLAMEPDYVLAHFWMARAYSQKRDYPAAIAEYQKALSIQPSNLLVLALMAHTYGVSGKSDEARKILSKLQETWKRNYVSPTLISIIHLGLGDKDQAMEWAEKGYQERDALLTRCKQDPITEPLRSDPRFQDLLKRVGLQP